MKLVCPACERITSAASFRDEGGVLLIRCGRCGAEGALEVEKTAPAPHVVPLHPVPDAVRIAAGAAHERDPFAVPEDRCPKCIGPRRPEATVCPHCGLAYVNFRDEEVAPSDGLRAAFLAALEQWDEAALHEKALAIATQTQELAQLGRLYRLRQVAAPDDPVAQRGRDEVLRRATAASEVLRSAEPAPRPSLKLWQYAVIAALGVVVLGLVAGLLRTLAR